MKTGRRKLGRIYAQELVFRFFFFFFFFSEKNFFGTVIVYFNACRFYTSRL